MVRKINSEQRKTKQQNNIGFRKGDFIMNISVIGSGGWGTAVAVMLAKKGYNIKLWSWVQEETDRLNRDR